MDETMGWLKARWEGIMFQQNYSYFEKVCIKQHELFGGSYKILSCVHEPTAYWFCYREDYASGFGDFLVKKFLADKKFYESFKKEYLGIVGSIEKLYDILEKKRNSLGSISDKELVETYLSALELTALFASYTLTCEPVELSLEQRLRQKIADAIKNDNGATDHAYAVFTAPDRPSYLQGERNELIRIAGMARAKGEDELSEQLPEYLADAVYEHARKWWWIRNSYAKQERLSEEFFVSELGEILRTGEKEAMPQASGEKQELLGRMGADDELRMLVQISGDYIYLHDLRKGELMKWVYYINIIIREFARRLGMSFEDAAFMTHHEIVDALLNKTSIPSNEISERRNAVSTYDEDKGHVWYGEEAESLKKEIFGTIEKGAKEIEGTPASPGHAKGRVRVLMSSSEVDSFNEGEILVTSHTTPDWVVIMRKAAAIITERGGITCHAAIVSRELGIPCITGVNNVTEILKDGELVEVDAIKGIIKRLK
jgi:phosphohistidine swiveling domain-containing protein